VAPYTPRGGGIGRMMTYLAEHQADDSVDFVAIESRGGSSAALSIGPFLRAGWRIAREAAASRDTILHINMAEGGSVFRKGLLLLWGRRLGLPTVLHLHAAAIVEFYDRVPAPVRTWIRSVFGSADVCVVLGETWRSWLQDDLGVAARRIVILPNGVPRPGVVAFRSSAKRPVLVFLGNLQPRKGLPDLIAALATAALKARDWDLVVAGGGDATSLRRMAMDAGIGERVRFVGWLGPADTMALLARAAMLILPSYREGLPLVLLEAASLGIPAVAAISGAIPEVFTPDETALLVEAGDITGLARSIGRLIDDPALRDRIGQNARALYDRSLSIGMFRQRMIGIYDAHCRRPIAGQLTRLQQP
jgi:glycosyltransferase involved in cell wall biosynthesis